MNLLNIEQQREAVRILATYADAAFYHGCCFAWDRPTGGFDDDFMYSQEYDYAKPGKMAALFLQDLWNYSSDYMKYEIEQVVTVCESAEWIVEDRVELKLIPKNI